jgi:hypothetical protein
MTMPGLASVGSERDSQLVTEFPFVLPRGYVDERGRNHREGRIRLATARDEIAPQADPRVRENPAYLTVLLLGRTVTSLGDIDRIDPAVIEGMYAADLAFLQDLYRRINQPGHFYTDVRCPACSHEFPVDLAGDALGES